jgi:hypothetical protein
LVTIISNKVVQETQVGFSDLQIATFDVVIGSLIFTVTVNLTVTNFFENHSLLQIIFSQELDYLKFKSDTAGTYVAIAIEIKVFKINTYSQ